MKNENIYSKFWKKITIGNYRFGLIGFIPILTVVYLFRSYWINVNESIWVSILYTLLFIIIVMALAKFFGQLKQNLFRKDAW